MHAATGTITLLLQCDFRGQPSVVDNSSPFFGRSFSISVKITPILPYCCCCASCATCVCGVCRVSRGVECALTKKMSGFCTGEAFFAVSATTKKTCILTNQQKYDTGTITDRVLAEPKRKSIMKGDSVTILIVLIPIVSNLSIFTYTMYVPSPQKQVHQHVRSFVSFVCCLFRPCSRYIGPS